MLTSKQVMEWVEFLSEERVIHIHDRAQDKGLGELDFYEWVYIDAQLAYNHAAENPSMDYALTEQLEEAKRELYATREGYRSDEIERFAFWL